MKSIQNEDIKSEADLVSAGADRTHLPNDDKIYITASSIASGRTLKEAIESGALGGGGEINYIAHSDADFGIGNWSAYSSSSSTTLAENIVAPGALNGYGITTSSTLPGQSFTPTSSGPLGSVRVTLLKSGVISGNVVIKVYADNSGIPGTLLATSAAISVGTIPNSFTSVVFSFASGPTLTSGQLYYLIIDASAVTGFSAGGDELDVYGSGIDVYAGGNSLLSTDGGATWSDFPTDLDFTVTANATPDVTLVTSTASPLRGAASFLFTKPASVTTNQGAKCPFTIDPADQGKWLTTTLDYLTAGTYVDADMQVKIYDVTNAQTIAVVPANILNAVTYGQITASFQTPTNSTSYEFRLEVVSASASAFTLEFDNVQVGPGSLVLPGIDVFAVPIWDSTTSKWIQNAEGLAWTSGFFQYEQDLGQTLSLIAGSGDPTASSGASSNGGNSGQIAGSGSSLGDGITGGKAGTARIVSGNSYGVANGGNAFVIGGNALGSGEGGNVILRPGTGASGQGAVVFPGGVWFQSNSFFFPVGDGANSSLTLSAGDGKVGGAGGELNGGDATIAGGAATAGGNGTGGYLYLQSGFGDGTGNGGDIQMSCGGSGTGRRGQTMIITDKLVVSEGGLRSEQTAATTIGVTANAGASAFASLTTATDVAGQMSMTTGTSGWATGAQVTVTFAKAYTTVPIVVICAANDQAALAAKVYVSATTNDFSINFATADAASTAYAWNYFIIETQ